MVSGSTSLKTQGAQKCIKKLRFTLTYGPRGQIKFKSQGRNLGPHFGGGERYTPVHLARNAVLLNKPAVFTELLVFRAQTLF